MSDLLNRVQHSRSLDNVRSCDLLEQLIIRWLARQVSRAGQEQDWGD